MQSSGFAVVAMMFGSASLARAVALLGCATLAGALMIRTAWADGPRLRDLAHGATISLEDAPAGRGLRARVDFST